MNVELQKKLVQRAPYMFKYDASDNQSPIRYYGFEVGDGWFDLLKTLILELKRLDTNQHLQVVQVKEKFGTLRFYINPIENTIYDAVMESIEKAEQISSITCELCGKPGTINNKGWISVRCPECRSKEKS